MYRDSYYEKIVNLVKIEPQSQTEIHKRIGTDKITIQGIAKNLNQAVEDGKLIFLGNKVSKKDAKFLLKHYFKRKWPFNAWQCYIYVPNTEKFYLRLKMKLKDKPIGREIILWYSLIELISMFQGLEFYDFEVIKRWFKSEGKYRNSEHINQRIEDKIKETKDLYDLRDKNDPILNLLEFTPLMYWCAFKRVTPPDSPRYNSERDLTLIKDKLIDNLREILKQPPNI